MHDQPWDVDPGAAAEEAAFTQRQVALGKHSIMLDQEFLRNSEDDRDITGALSGAYAREVVGGDHSPGGAAESDGEEGELGPLAPVQPRMRVRSCE